MADSQQDVPGLESSDFGQRNKQKPKGPSTHSRYDSDSESWQIPEQYFELAHRVGGTHLEQLLDLRTQQTKLKSLAVQIGCLPPNIVSHPQSASERYFFDWFIRLKILQLKNHLRQWQRSHELTVRAESEHLITHAESVVYIEHICTKRAKLYRMYIAMQKQQAKLAG